MDPFAIVALFAGGVIAFTGYRIYLDIQRFWGFLLIGAVGAYFATLLFPEAGGAFHLSIPLGAGFLIGGVIGALIARQLSVVIVFLTGFLGGYAAVTTIYNLVVTSIGMVRTGSNAGGGSGLQLTFGGPAFFVALAIGALIGAIAIRWEDVTLIIAMSFIGAALAIYGAASLLNIQPLIAVIIFFLIGLFGAAAQYTDARHRD